MKKSFASIILLLFAIGGVLFIFLGRYQKNASMRRLESEISYNVKVHTEVKKQECRTAVLVRASDIVDSIFTELDWKYYNLNTLPNRPTRVNLPPPKYTVDSLRLVPLWDHYPIK